jgi:subtilisin family serine protease
MTKFIALRRRPRTTMMGLDAMSFEEKRSRIVRDAPLSERTEALKGLGLQQVEPEERGPEVEDKFQRLGYAGAYVVDTPSEQMAEKAREVLEEDYQIVPDIELGLPRPSLSQTFRRRPRRASYWPEDSGVTQAHKDGVTGKGVLVGVLDTGCDADHLELRGKRIEFRYVPLYPSPDGMRACRGFDTDGHGTHVSGIIAGKNVGVAPDVDLMVASVIESETVKTSLERIVIALDWMLSQFQLDENLSKPFVINMSLGFRPEWISASHMQSVIDGIKLILSTLVVDFDVLPVVAIGNDGAGIVRAPGYFAEALSVGAVDVTLSPAWFSGGGHSPLSGEPEPDIAGYGVDVLSSLERDVERHSLYAEMSGTSMASPYVAGVAALVAAANPGLQGAALRQYLVQHAMPLAEPETRVGAGLARFE